jgi:hypothetical protein
MRVCARLRVTRFPFYPKKKRTRGKEEHTTAREKNDASERTRAKQKECVALRNL